MSQGNRNTLSPRFFRIAFLLFLPIFGFIAYNVFQQSYRITELEKLIPERIALHKSLTGARRARVKAMEDKAATAGEDQRDKLAEEAKTARQVVDDATATDRAEILALWNEARDAGSKMPMPEFGE